jgi:hypothetical protein
MSEQYRDFTITWQEPPLTGAKWTANIVTDDRRLLLLLSRAEVIDGISKRDMLVKSQRYIDDLLAKTRPDVPGSVGATVRDIFLERSRRKANDVPWPEIKEHLINRGHDIGHGQMSEVGGGNRYINSLSRRVRRSASMDLTII